MRLFIGAKVILREHKQGLVLKTCFFKDQGVFLIFRTKSSGGKNETQLITSIHVLREAYSFRGKNKRS
jgi:hypothetical protein